MVPLLPLIWKPFLRDLAYHKASYQETSAANPHYKANLQFNWVEASESCNYNYKQSIDGFAQLLTRKMLLQELELTDCPAQQRLETCLIQTMDTDILYLSHL